MEQPAEKKTETQQLKDLLPVIDEIARKHISNCSEEEVSFLLRLIKNTHVFQKSLDPQISFEDFLHRIKFFIRSELHPKGTILQYEGQQADRLCIILRGAAVRFQQRTIAEIEREIAEISPGFSLQKIEELENKSPFDNVINVSPVHNYIRSPTITSKLKEKSPIKKMKAETKTQLQDLEAASPRNSNEEGTGSPSPASLENLENMEEEREEDTVKEVTPSDKNKKKKGGMKKVQKVGVIEEPAIMSVLNSLVIDNENDKATKRHDVEMFRKISEQMPHLVVNLFLGDILKVKRAKQLSEGNHFGEEFLKETKPRNNLLVATEDIHLISISKESFLQVMNQLLDEIQDKLTFFSSAFPFMSEKGSIIFASYFQEKHLKKGEKIFSEDDPVNGIYILRCGDIRLFKNIEIGVKEKNTSSGPEHLFKGASRSLKTTLQVTSVTEGQFFGEEVFLKRPNRTFTATCASAFAKIYFLEEWLYNRIKVNYVEIFTTLKTQAKEKAKWRRKRVEEMITHQSLTSLDNPGSPTKKSQAFDSKEKVQTQALGSPIFARPKAYSTGLELNDKYGPENVVQTEPSAQYPRDNKKRLTNHDEFETDPLTARNLEIYKEKFYRKKNVYKLMDNEKLAEKKNPTSNGPVILEPVPLPIMKRKKNNLSISISPNQTSPANANIQISARQDGEESAQKREKTLPPIEKVLSPRSPILKNVSNFRSNVLNLLVPGFDREMFESIATNKDVVKNTDGTLTVVTGRSRLREVLRTFDESPSLHSAFKSASPRKFTNIQLDPISATSKTENDAKKKMKKRPVPNTLSRSPSQKIFNSQNEALGSVIMTQKLNLVKH